MKKKLILLLKNLSGFQVYGRKSKEITGIADNSKDISRGYIFVAIKGEKHDAHNFIPEAITRGASVIFGEQSPQKSWLSETTYIKVTNARYALSLLASVWYGHPSKKLSVIGVTGTDGKTTTANLIYWILKNSKIKTGLISTIGAKIGDREYDTGLHVTNPEPLQLQELLSKMVNRKCEYVILEVTSHGLNQARVAGVEFTGAILTNITHEHLDYHKTWKNYREAKAKLFKKALKFVVLNKNDKSFNYISSLIPKKVKKISYNIKASADFKADKLKIVKSKMNFNVRNDGRTYNLSSELLGKYNLENILAAVACTREIGVSWPVIKKTLDSFPNPTGRLEEIKNKQGLKIFVDFAHTPNSLKEVLSFLRTVTENKLIVVFGSAGQRDKKKRHQMGEIAAELSDISILTAEDPRNEDVNDIINEMVKGVKKAGSKELVGKPGGKKIENNGFFIKIPERGEAIAFAVQKLAKKGDTVVICGKGHERSMAYDGIEYPWSDQEAVRIALRGGTKRIKR